jgi:hypothetical protein
MPADDEAPATDDYLDELRRTISHLVAPEGVHGGMEIAPIALRSFHRAQRVLGEGRYVPTIERDLEAVTTELGTVRRAGRSGARLAWRRDCRAAHLRPGTVGIRRRHHEPRPGVVLVVR